MACFHALENKYICKITLGGVSHMNCVRTLSMSRLLALAAMWCVVFPCESLCLHMFLQRSGIFEACVTSICYSKGRRNVGIQTEHILSILQT